MSDYQSRIINLKCPIQDPWTPLPGEYKTGYCDARYAAAEIAAKADARIAELEARIAAADRLAYELDNMATQHGCDCGHPHCKTCGDTRDARAAFYAYHQAAANYAAGEIKATHKEQDDA